MSSSGVAARSTRKRSATAPALECAASTPVPEVARRAHRDRYPRRGRAIELGGGGRGSRNAADGRPCGLARRPVGSGAAVRAGVRRPRLRGPQARWPRGVAVPRRAGVRTRTALQLDPRSPAPELRAPRRPVDHRCHRRRAANVASDRPARTAGARAADDGPGRPAAHEAAGVGDQRQGSWRHHLPARRSAALGACVRPRGDRLVAHPRSDRRRLGPVPHARAEPANRRWLRARTQADRPPAGSGRPGGGAPRRDRRGAQIPGLARPRADR